MKDLVQSWMDRLQLISVIVCISLSLKVVATGSYLHADDIFRHNGSTVAGHHNA